MMASGADSGVGGKHDPRQTPAMRQYFAFKRQHPGCVVFFRMGDFYEMFDDDAINLSRALGLTLTRRQNDIPMAGVPFHQRDNYLRRAIEAGFRVVVVDQLEDPKEAKGVVERGVTAVVTPGTLIEESLLGEEQTAVVAAACFVDEGRVGVAAIELVTGACNVFEGSVVEAGDELARLRTREVLYAEAPTLRGRAPAESRDATAVPERVLALLSRCGAQGTARPPRQFHQADALAEVQRQWGVRTAGGFGLRDDEASVWALGALLRYLRETQAIEEERAVDGDEPPGAGVGADVGAGVGSTVKRTGERRSAAAAALAQQSGRRTLAHLSSPRRLEASGLCMLDQVSLRALEVERTLRADGATRGASEAEGSLLGVFVAAATGPRSVFKTVMGRRLIREWLCRPLASAEAVVRRQDAVSVMLEDRRLAGEVGGMLAEVQDVARIAGRCALGRATPRDMVGLGRSLRVVDGLAGATAGIAALGELHGRLASVRGELGELAGLIAGECVDEPPQHLREGGLIRDGVDAELDEARGLQRDAGAWLAEYQARLIAEHDLPSLKVGYNKIFGYYIELPAAQARRAPAALSRKQTLKNAERYITPELHEFESKVTTASARAVEREQELFRRLCARAARVVGELQSFAGAAAEMDVLLGLAEKARARGWVRPVVVEEPVIEVRGGRHPVLDEVLGQRFVPNDLDLGSGSTDGIDGDGAARLALITGPNMAGKSTFIRQTALLVLLASVGSWVPAESAVIGVCDRICTRVGADDALHRGQSTFMVEMTETASILNLATSRSLVVLDEIGRGTSTLDGLSLAWAIAEELAGVGEASEDGGQVVVRGRPRTLFATHYHELTELAERAPGRVRNLQVSVREWTSPAGAREIVFEHVIKPGRADQSYGVHVARLAGVPTRVTRRAEEVLRSLSVQHAGAGREAPPAVPGPGEGRRGGQQLSLFTEYVAHPAVVELNKVQIDRLSPMQAFDELRRLKEMAERA